MKEFCINYKESKTLLDGTSILDGIYVDDDYNKYVVYIKCSHLGCNLIFNEVDKIWDCPCHGSGFDVDGKSISGPSNYSITYNENR